MSKDREIDQQGAGLEAEGIDHKEIIAMLGESMVQNAPEVVQGDDVEFGYARQLEIGPVVIDINYLEDLNDAAVREEFELDGVHPVSQLTVTIASRHALDEPYVAVDFYDVIVDPSSDDLDGDDGGTGILVVPNRDAYFDLANWLAHAPVKELGALKEALQVGLRAPNFALDIVRSPEEAEAVGQLQEDIRIHPDIVLQTKRFQGGNVVVSTSTIWGEKAPESVRVIEQHGDTYKEVAFRKGSWKIHQEDERGSQDMTQDEKQAEILEGAKWAQALLVKLNREQNSGHSA